MIIHTDRDLSLNGMETFTPKTFNIPELVGIGAKNIEEHLKLYIVNGRSRLRNELMLVKS